LAVVTTSAPANGCEEDAKTKSASKARAVTIRFPRFFITN
jgi:hypothetical protein